MIARLRRSCWRGTPSKQPIGTRGGCESLSQCGRGVYFFNSQPGRVGGTVRAPRTRSQAQARALRPVVPSCRGAVGLPRGHRAPGQQGGAEGPARLRRPPRRQSRATCGPSVPPQSTTPGCQHGTPPAPCAGTPQQCARQARGPRSLPPSGSPVPTQGPAAPMPRDASADGPTRYRRGRRRLTPAALLARWFCHFAAARAARKRRQRMA